MVHEVDVDHLGGFTELPGDLDIRSAGGRVAGGVVVSDYEGRGAGEDGSAEHLAGCASVDVAVPRVTRCRPMGWFLRSR